MPYIMCGGNISQVFKDLYIPPNEAKKVYSSQSDDFEIWEVSKLTVNTLYSIPNKRWDSNKWGWWCFARKSYTLSPIDTIEVNGKSIKAWMNETVSPKRTFNSLKEYSEYMWNKESDYAFMDLVTNLAGINNMTVPELLYTCD